MTARVAGEYQAVEMTEEAPPRPSSLRRSMSSLRRSDKYDKAASRISDAIEGVMRPQPLEGRCATCLFHVHLTCHVFIKAVLVPGLLVLSFFERPFWCEGSECECIWTPVDVVEAAGGDKEGGEDGSTVLDSSSCPYPTFDITYLNDQYRLYAEASILCAVVLHQATLRGALGGRGYWASHGAEFLATLALCGSIALLETDKVYHYADFATILGERVKLWLPTFRLFVYAAYSEDVRSQCAVVSRIVPHYVRIGTLVALLTVVFAWFGVVLFPTSSQSGSLIRATEGDEYFPNLREGMWNLLVLITTANFPDVAIPAYASNRWSMLFFVGFLLFGMFFAMNLLLATVYNVYVDEQTKATARAEAARDANLKLAFESLKPQPDVEYVSTTAIQGVFAALNLHQEVLYIDDERSEQLLAALDHTVEARVPYEDFHKLCGLIQLTKVVPDPAPGVLTDILQSDLFEYCVDAVILLNCVAVAAQTRDEILGRRDRSAEESEGPAWELIETTLAGLYFAEMCLKVYAFGLAPYLAYVRNRIDAAVAVASVATAAVVYVPNAYNDASFLRYVLVVRLVRVLRVLEMIPDFRIIGEAFLAMLPAAARLLKFLFCVTYLAAVVGMALFGGLLRDTPDQIAKLQDTGFYQAGYLPLNFNDFWSSYVVLFAVLVINNWQVVTEGFVAVYGVNARLFFIAYYSVGTLIGVNLAVAFVIDSFNVEFDKAKKLNDQNRLRRASSIRARRQTPPPGSAQDHADESILTPTSP